MAWAPRDRLPHDRVFRFPTDATGGARNRRPACTPSPARPHKQRRDIDGVVKRGGRILAVPGDTEANLEIITGYLRQLETGVRQILRPFRHQVDAKPTRL